MNIVSFRHFSKNIRHFSLENFRSDGYSLFSSLLKIFVTSLLDMIKISSSDEKSLYSSLLFKERSWVWEVMKRVYIDHFSSKKGPGFEKWWKETIFITSLQRKVLGLRSDEKSLFSSLLFKEGPWVWEVMKKYGCEARLLYMVSDEESLYSSTVGKKTWKTHDEFRV